jgi:hypothetical protein
MRTPRLASAGSAFTAATLAVALGYGMYAGTADAQSPAPAAPPAPQAQPAPPPEASPPRARTDRDVRVHAPHTDVAVDKERGRVHVRAPYTDVKVDPDRGRVRVRAPYVNLDIRW